MTVTPLYAALCGLLLILLSQRVIRQRHRYKVALGDAGEPQIRRAMRVQANFVEYVPMAIILLGILGFVAGFAISLGPIMWVLFSELFPNQVRGLAISFVGLINSAVSFSVQLVFPWELQTFGNSVTFLIYGVFAIVGLLIIMRLLPETKGKSLEELETELVRH